MTADALRDSIAQAIESVAHDPGGRPCEPCVETADAVLGDWLRLVDEHLQAHLCEPVYTRPRPEEAHTVDIGHVHVLTTPGGSCAPTCPHPDHRTEETPDAG